MASDTTAAATDSHDIAESLVEHATEAAGMPQLNFDTYANQIFWLVLTLIAIYLILVKVALPRVAAVLSERQGTITNDVAAAEELKQKAVEAEEAYQKALADARVEAAKIVADTKAEIQAELDVATAKADAEISAKAAESEKAIAEIRDGAMAAVKEVATDVAAEIVSTMGMNADAGAIAAAVTDRMKG